MPLVHCSEGVAIGFRGINLTEPSTYPLSTLNQIPLNIKQECLCSFGWDIKELS